ncbi:MAG: hypothetical protein RBT34_04390 [Anaerolineaceae bacterium]|jgi:hypothetical protein|nr:hypothetical protein [Anaerolineaceae bacterium]
MTAQEKKLPVLARVWDCAKDKFASATVYDTGHPVYMYADFGDDEATQAVVRNAATEAQVNRICELAHTDQLSLLLHPSETTEAEAHKIIQALENMARDWRDAENDDEIIRVTYNYVVAGIRETGRTKVLKDAHILDATPITYERMQAAHGSLECFYHTKYDRIRLRIATFEGAAWRFEPHIPEAPPHCISDKTYIFNPDENQFLIWEDGEIIYENRNGQVILDNR